MPSPISSTRPTSSARSLVRYCSISVWRTETISSGLNLITASLYELFADGVQPALDRRIEPPVAHLDDHAGDQVGIDACTEHGLHVELGPNFLSQCLGLVLRQWNGANDVHAQPASPRLEQVAIGRVDGPNRVEPLVLVQNEEEV